MNDDINLFRAEEVAYLAFLAAHQKWVGATWEIAERMGPETAAKIRQERLDEFLASFPLRLSAKGSPPPSPQYGPTGSQEDL